jgi:hypothetical protein
MGIEHIPLLTALNSARSVLIVGAGGGFDVFCGLPLYFYLRQSGKAVHLANLSFSLLAGATALAPNLYAVTANSRGLEHYFPEKYLAQWFTTQGQDVPIYVFERTGAQPLAQAYAHLQQRLGFDAVVLIDGGTDSLMRGDEAGLGTPEEDAISLIAVDALSGVEKYLLCLGFGVDSHHGICHAQFLEAVAALTTTGDYLGAWSLLPAMPEVEQYRAACQFVFEKMPTHPSIVSTSVLDGIAGVFGDVHATEKTRGSQLFINPLMALYWAFRLDGVVKRHLYLDWIRGTQDFYQVRQNIADFRETSVKIKPWQALPM